MSEKRETREGVYGVVLRDPRDRVKAALAEPQPPVMQGHIPCDSAWCRATLLGCLTSRHPNPPQRGRWGMPALTGADGAPTSRSHVSDRGKAGWPTGREP